MKLSVEIIYKRKQSIKQSRLGFSVRQIVLIKEKRKHFYITSDRVSKRLRRKGLFLKGWIRECFVEVYIDNRCKIVII
jgi:hypothetical protein